MNVSVLNLLRNNEVWDDDHAVDTMHQVYGIYSKLDQQHSSGMNSSTGTSMKPLPDRLKYVTCCVLTKLIDICNTFYFQQGAN